MLDLITEVLELVTAGVAAVSALIVFKKASTETRLRLQNQKETSERGSSQNKKNTACTHRPSHHGIKGFKKNVHLTLDSWWGNGMQMECFA